MNYPQNSDDYQSVTNQYYEDNAQDYYQSTVDLDLASLYSPFLELLSPGAHILDAGCGSGRDSLYFLNQGYKVSAFDASPVLARLASSLIGQSVLNIKFSQLDFIDEFNAIWACASLLHVPRSEIGSAFTKLSRSLKPGGIFYMSFKYGDKECFRNGRWFNDYDESSFLTLLRRHPHLSLIKIWKTTDIRPTRPDIWLNILLRKEIQEVKQKS
jgi:SAM-dependent methyltransferase